LVTDTPVRDEDPRGAVPQVCGILLCVEELGRLNKDEGVSESVLRAGKDHLAWG